MSFDEQKYLEDKTDVIFQNIKNAGIRATRSDFIDRQPLKDCFHSDSCPHIQIDMNSKTIYHTLDAIDPSIVHDCKQRQLVEKYYMKHGFLQIVKGSIYLLWER